MIKRLQVTRLKIELKVRTGLDGRLTVVGVDDNRGFGGLGRQKFFMKPEGGSSCRGMDFFHEVR